MIYQRTRDFPKEEQFGLSSQLRRAAVSVVSNLAEGSTRSTPRDKAQFYTIAYGSCTEIIAQIIIASDLDYISQENYQELREQLERCTRMINALKNSQLK